MFAALAAPLRPRAGSRVTALGKALLVVCGLSLAVGSSGDALSLKARYSSANNHHAAKKPKQRWGSATGQPHIVKSGANRNIPSTLRSKYPQGRPQAVQAAAGRPRNSATVGSAPRARAQGFDAAKSRELPERRDARRRSYLNADGTETTEFSTTPINYWDRARKAWSPIDPALVPGDGQQGWRNKADAVDLRLAPRADTPTLASLALDADHAVAFGLAGAQPAAGRAEGAAVTYGDALPGGTDLRLQSTPGGLKETLTLRSADAPPSYVFPLALKGLTPKLDHGQIVFTDNAGRQRATIPAGYMWDSAAKPETSKGVTYSLVKSGAGVALRMDLDAKWLRDPARRFPVSVDPSVASGAADSSLVVHGGDSSSGDNELLVGRKDGAAAASYIRFGGLADQLKYHTIFGAQLQVVNFDAPSCSPRKVTVHPVTQSWSSGGSYSYPGPDVGGALTSQSFAYGYVKLGQSHSACQPKGTLFDLGAGGRKLVQGWVDGGANNGLSLRASSSDDTAWKRFAGTGTANPPRLYVTHSPYNAKYAIPNPVPQPPVLQNQAGKVKITVTNLSAETWTPSTYYLAYRAYDAATGKAVTQQRAASLPGNLARGARTTLDATIQPLKEGRYFLDFTMVRSGGKVFTDEQVPPGRIVLQVFNVPPVLQELFPPNGYQAQTLAPQLWARGLDIDAPAGQTLKYKFEVCDQDSAGKPVNCTSSAYQDSPAWTPPAGRLVWSKSYQWRAFVKDATTEVPSPYATLLTNVPQPAITSNIAGSPYASQDREFDPQVGNLSTSAVDVPVATVGPDLTLARTYNSLDPRRASPFGAGWTTRYDMRLTEDKDGTGNAVIAYPDGQEVRFGKNPDGSYAAPQGRTALLTFDGTNFKLRDRGSTTYQFSGTGRLSRITDAGGRSLVLTYNQQDGRLAKVQVSNSQTNTAGRALSFTWSGDHVATVSTDPVNGAPLTWNYTYTGDLLTKVCAPGSVCTNYEYAQNSHYRTAVLDDRPESYWRLGESEGDAAGSEIAVNLGKDRGAYKNVTLLTPGAPQSSGNTAATFNGSSSSVDLPKGIVKKSRDAAIELWFKANPTGTGGPLIGYQDKALGTAATKGVPLLYHGSDGRLRGQFWNGTIAPITSSKTVNDGKWHHVVLSSMGATQTLYLDGAVAGTTTNPASTDISALTYNQIGAANVHSPASWPGWGGSAERHYNGAIDEVSVYAHPLGAAAVADHYGYGAAAADQLTKVTTPGGRTAVEADYDSGTARITEYTDSDGGTWKIGAPAVYGGDTDLRRGVEVRDPSDRPYLYEYDALAGRMIRSGTPTGLGIKDEDKADPTPSSPQTSPPSTICSTPDPGDPQFCTTIPGTANGPVFEGHNLDGMAIRTFDYDDRGYQKTITNENGDSVYLTYDDRGNVVTKKTCRTKDECYTEYTTYPAAPTDPFDPRNDLPTEKRDGRSSGPTDNRYRTTYTYHPTGQLVSQTGPDGATVKHTYTSGAESAVGGGSMPPGLPLTTTDPRQAVTKYAYFQNGDLARVTEPSGQITTFTYDALGRKISETATNDAYPNGVTTTYAYDALSRPTVTTAPVTTDAVNGTKHQTRTVTTYDADGNALTTEASDLLGGDAPRKTTYEYDEYGRVERVTDPVGGETSYGYDRFGNKTWMVDPRGNRYEYGYTARNMIAEVRLRDWDGDPDGAGDPGKGDYLVVDSYAYDFAGRMVRNTDAMGRRVEFAYYNDDLPKSKTLTNYHAPDGSVRDYVLESQTYDGAGNLLRQTTANGTTVTDKSINPNGTVAAVVQDPGGLNRRTAFAYDLNGNVTRTTTSGAVSNVPWIVSTAPEVVDMTYDLSGNLTKQIQTSGTTTRITSFTYDQRGLQTSRTDPRGNVDGADKAAYTTTYGYDELGRQVSLTAPKVSAESNGGPAQDVTPVQAVGYNAYGETVATKDALGNVTRTSYDVLGRPTETTSPTYTPPGSSTPITPTTRQKYDAAGNVVESIDAEQRSTRYTYDRLGRLTKRDEPTGTNGDRAVWNYTYTRTGEVLSVTDPNGARVETTYDDMDRQQTVTQVERRPQLDNFTTRYVYDEAGNLASTTSPTGAVSTAAYNAVGEPIEAKDPSGVTTKFGYDFTGRRVRTTDGLGRTSRIDYDDFGQVAGEYDLKPDNTVLRAQTYRYDATGNLIASTDPEQRTTTYDYDAGNRLIRQVEPVDDTKSITTSFGYDAAGNRTRYTDGRGNSTVFTVNTLGLPESVVEPSTPSHPSAADRTWTAAYDINGDPVKTTAPGGITRQRTYDDAGRLVKETGGGAATTDRVLSYDQAGRLIKADAPGGTNVFGYNDRGALITADGPSGKAAFAYDGDGRLTSRDDRAGKSTYGYVKGRIATVTDGITGVTQTLGYDAAGMPKTIDYGAGRMRTFGYDDYGRLSSDVLKNGAGATVASIDYDYDKDDRLTGKKTVGTADAGTNTYTYDFAGRLTSWKNGEKTTPYEWDDSGNRTRDGPKTATYDARNRLQSDGDYTYTYSPRGTIDSKTSSGYTEKFTFDAFDRLISEGTTNFTYDSLDRTASRNGTDFAYAGTEDDPVYDGTTSYARDPAGELMAMAQGTAKRLAFSDKHGDVVGDIDPADTTLTGLTESTAYSPYGQVIAQTSGGNLGQIGYQGDWTDPSTKQVNMGARWYDPSSGTFDSRDSVDYSSGDSVYANRYTYAAGSPMTLDDDTGNWPSCGWCKKVGGWVNRNIVQPIYNNVIKPIYNYVIKPVIGAAKRFGGWVSKKVSQAVNYGRTLWNNAKSLASDWAQRAARAKAAAVARAKAITAKARSAIHYAATHSTLDVLKAAVKPLYTGLSKLVSMTPHLPAGLTSFVKNIIKDSAKAVGQLYQAAVKQAGAVIHEVSNAAHAVSQFAQNHVADIAGIATGLIVGAGCGAAIGWTGVGAVACGALAGAAGSLVHDLVEGGHSWKEMGLNALRDGVIGGITGGLGSIGGAGLKAGLGVVLRGGGLRAGGQAARSAAGAEARAIGNGLLRRCSNSFASGTPVLMSDGSTKSIEDIKIGDRVVATDPTTGKTTTQPVTDTIVGSGEKNLVQITVDTDGKRGKKTGVVIATDGHPFWVASLRKWLKADELKPGMWLRTSAGTRVQITAIAKWSEQRRVYNLTVDHTHTYYTLAGAAPVLVHNCGGFIGPLDHVALGRREYDLKGFAEKVGARHLLGARSDSWKDEVKAAIARSSRGEGNISFMLDGLPGANRGAEKALAAAKAAQPHSLLDTQWELLEVDAAGMMDRVNFYRFNRRLNDWAPL
ncbi:hypothetical protein ACRB68_42920 [Actinomadura sp. RB68]|uniref:DNRLRE domain-containing protein n=1 Tax=Actinomadura macrotermitis TaxID=2585200 RepID=A0A7K0BYP7_9ACTN|nr:hypothetical protein [Actinomadura macrotermitis]